MLRVLIVSQTYLVSNNKFWNFFFFKSFIFNSPNHYEIYRIELPDLGHFQKCLNLQLKILTKIYLPTYKKGFSIFWITIDLLCPIYLGHQCCINFKSSRYVIREFIHCVTKKDLYPILYVNKMHFLPTDKSPTATNLILMGS